MLTVKITTLLSLLIITAAIEICPENWTKIRHSCYKLFTNPMKWDESTDECHKNNAELLILDSIDKLRSFGPFSENFTNQNFWIGLKFTNRTFKWIDESKLQIARWSLDQKAAPQDTVCAYSNHENYWYLAECNQKKQFICERKVESVVPCPDKTENWYFFNGFCFKLFIDKTETWENAEESCQDHQANLASIQSEAEDGFARKVIRLQQKVPGYVWIGLNTENSALAWTDGTVLNFTKIKENNINFKCFQLTDDIRLWKNVKCNDKSLKICKRLPFEQYTIYQEPKSIQLSQTSNVCEEGWRRVGNKCVKLFHKTESWDKAKQNCKSQNADLATIHNKFENDAMVELIKSEERSAWIGLNDKKKERSFEWQDQSSVDYLNWGISQPDDYASSEDCVVLSVEHFKWNDLNCNEPNFYLCQKTINAPEDIVFKNKCKNLSAIQIGSNCYKVIQDRKESWIGSQTQCEKYSGNLVSISSKFELLALDHVFRTLKLTNMANQKYWIGLKVYDIGLPLSWSDLSPVKFYNWQEAFWYNREDGCTFINPQDKWKTQSCDLKSHFICKFSSNVQMNINSTKICPIGNWYDFGTNFCYSFHSKSATWNSALKTCKAQESNLISIHDQQTVNIMADHLELPYYQHLDIWIGLTEQNGKQQWSDGSNLRFTAFIDQSTRGKNNSCLAFDPEMTQWKMIDCDDHNVFVCATPKIDPRDYDNSGIPQKIIAKIEDPGAKYTSGCSAGKIIGFVALVIVCVILIVAIGYVLFKKFRNS